MPSRSSLNVSLTPELEKFVQERVKSGRYQTASEVVREALRLLELREEEREEALRGVRQKLQRGLEQAKRGELVDGEEFMDKLVKRLQRKYKKSRAA
jgi:antitoxin ParD1/3/4